jgi:hypothetical protein
MLTALFYGESMCTHSDRFNLLAVMPLQSSGGRFATGGLDIDSQTGVSIRSLPLDVILIFALFEKAAAQTCAVSAHPFAP